MKTWLLTWNPMRLGWRNMDDAIEEIRQNGHMSERWSCGLTKSIEPGDRVFLVRLGTDPRGVVARGTVTKGSYPDRHWDAERAANGDSSWYVMVDFDLISERPLVLRSELDEAPFSAFSRWSPQNSGIRLDDTVADELERLMRERAA